MLQFFFKDVIDLLDIHLKVLLYRLLKVRCIKLFPKPYIDTVDRDLVGVFIHQILEDEFVMLLILIGIQRREKRNRSYKVKLNKLNHSFASFSCHLLRWLDLDLDEGE